MIKKFVTYKISDKNQQEFNKEIAEVNFSRSKNLSIPLFFIFLVLLFIDYSNYNNGLWQENWGYRYLFYSHVFFVLTVPILHVVLFIKRTSSQVITTQMKKYFVIAFSFSILVGSSLTSIADQLIHGEITIYVLCILLIAIVNYQKPHVNFLMYTITHIIFLVGITYTQSNPVILKAHYFNGTFLVMLALFVSRLLFMAKVKDFNSRKTIEQQNNELEETNLELSATNQQLQESLLALDESQNIIFSLTVTLESKDQNTHGHSQRVAHYVIAIAKHLGLDQKDKVNLWRAAILHDLGKIGIPDAILNKPFSLTDDEWDIMKSHPERGEAICSRLKFAREILPIIRHHHERYDGNGYPDGLQGESIPFLSRIVSIADTVDAITSTRSYRPDKRTMEQAIEELKRCSGTQFDPKLVHAFEEVYKSDPDGLISEDIGDRYDLQ